MRRSLILLVLLVLAVIALPATTVYYLAFTGSGLQLMTRLIPRHAGHLRLRIEGVTGTAVSGMHADRIVIDDRRAHIIISDVYGRIILAPLLLRTLRVPRLTIGRLYIRVRTHGGYPKRRHWHFLPPGLQIQADDVEVAAGTLILPSGRRFDATRIAAAGLLRRDTTRLDRVSLYFGRMHVSGGGRLRAGHPFGMNFDVLSTIRTKHQPTWVIAAHGKGNVEKLGLSVRFIEPLQANFTGSAASLTRTWRLQGRARIANFELRPWHGSDTALGAVTGELRLEADRRGFTARGLLRATGVPGQIFDATMRGRYAHRVIRVQRVLIRHRGSGATLVGHGAIGIAAHGPRLELAGTWSQFRWPLDRKAAAVQSPSGHFLLKGIWPYALRASGRLVVEDLEPIAFDLTGRLGKRHLEVQSASLKAFGGAAQLTAASATWSPHHAWSATGTAINVNPGTVRPDLPGRLTFGFKASGAHFNAKTDFTLAVRHLAGEVRGLTATASGLISRRRSAWTLAGVQGQIGRNTFSIGGTIDDAIDLRFRVAASHLGALEPRLDGRLRASGTLRGPRRSPSIDVSASGAHLRYRGVSLGRFDARVDFDPRRSGPSLVRLQAHDLAYRRHHLDVSFTLNGPPAQEHARLALVGARYRLVSRAVGALTASAWTGRISRLTFTGGGKRFTLDGTSALAVSARAIRLDQLCLSGKTLRVCGAADWAPGEWSVSTLAHGVPLALLTAGLPRGVRLQGMLGAALSASKHGAEPAHGHLSLRLAGAKMVRQTADGQRQTTSLGSGAVTLSATPARLRADIALDGSTVGSIDGTVVAHRSAAGWASAALTGSIAARTAIGIWSPLYTARIDQASGEASARLTLAGTLGSPRLSGELEVVNGALDLYQYNLDVRDAHLRARFGASGLQFTGAARVGAGNASAHGRLAWHHGAPYGRFELSGSNLRVVDLSQAVVDASPHLDFEVEGQRVGVTGTVRIPHAHIAPAQLTNEVRVSADQILAGERASRSIPRLRVTSAVTIELGDHVSLATQGLKGRLQGSVRVNSGGGAITRATGQLRIADGSYSAYGRTLDIASGRLIYTGSPIDDPGIDIRAQRSFQDPDVGAAVAGMDVRGTLRNPRITFFSEPPLPQQQIISLVFAGGTLFGGPQLGVSATANTSRSVNAQLIGQGAAVLGSEVGLPLAIEPTYNNDTALVLGKYLSPRLYVSYGVTLLQSLNIVQLRYTLGDHWSLSTELGQLGGADIVYSFEK